jgi:hypothetical protein
MRGSRWFAAVVPGTGGEKARRHHGVHNYCVSVFVFVRTLLFPESIRSRVLAIGRTEHGTPTPALLSPPRGWKPNASIPRAVPAPLPIREFSGGFAMKFPICVIHRKRTASFRIVSWIFTIVPLWLMLCRGLVLGLLTIAPAVRSPFSKFLQGRREGNYGNQFSWEGEMGNLNLTAPRVNATGTRITLVERVLAFLNYWYASTGFNHRERTADDYSFHLFPVSDAMSCN